MTIKTILLFVLLLFTTKIVDAGTIRHDVDDKKYLEYGRKHECVVVLYGKNKEGLNFNASGVIINANWIVTAAHVVKDCSDVKIMLKGKIIKLKNIIVKKEFEKTNKDKDNDIAVCESEAPMVLEFYPKLYDKKDELGKICSISGFGTTGTGLTGANRSDNARRAGSNIIDNVNEDILFCSMNHPGEEDTELEYCISHGDSGGGLFIDQKLAGINSIVIAADGKPDSNYGDESGHTRISKYKDWIENSITIPKEK